MLDIQKQKGTLEGYIAQDLDRNGSLHIEDHNFRNGKCKYHIHVPRSFGCSPFSKLDEVFKASVNLVTCSKSVISSIVHS